MNFRFDADFSDDEDTPRAPLYDPRPSAPPPVLSNVRARSLSGMLSTAAQEALPEEPGVTTPLEGVAVGEWQWE